MSPAEKIVPPADTDDGIVTDCTCRSGLTGKLTSSVELSSSELFPLAPFSNSDPVVFVFTTTWNNPCSVVGSVNCSDRA